jgi:hypothetical protein
METLDPLRLRQYANSAGFGLMWTNWADASPSFEAAGIEPHGYAWAGIARVLIDTHTPELADLVTFDCEADMFVAYGEDADALVALGTLLRDLYRAPDRLATLLRETNHELLD